MGHLPFERRQKQILERIQATTSPKYGKSPNERTTEELLVNGIVVIDKPDGPSSHQVSAYVKQIIDIDKAGHSGTLDPGVTGVLPVALSKGTRIVQSLLPAGKEYVCLMHVHAAVPEEKIREVIKQFVGKIKQLPPIKSAVKRQWRFRKVYYIDVLEIKGQEVLYTCGVQAGTYIRKLCHDMGTELGCGAHMAELRRSKAAGFNESHAVTLQDLTDAVYYFRKEGDDTRLRKMVFPVEEGVSHLAKIWVLDSAVETLCQGMQLKMPGIVKLDNDIQADDMVAVMTLKDELVLVGKALMASKQMLSERGIAVKTEQVFMVPGTYPKQDRA